ncbi:MAG: M14 family metallopeptidase [Pseudomonadales bacterium]
MSASLRSFHGVPDGLVELDARALATRLGGPSLIYVPGRRGPPLFVSVLLHGNETGGWEGVRRLLRDGGLPRRGGLPRGGTLPRRGTLPRSLLLFIGNVAAAAAGVRTLPDQQDYNRIWRGAIGTEAALAAEVMSAVAAHRPFAAVDLHNNTGRNPHYAVLTELTRENLGLARLFDDKAVYVQEPDSVLARAFAGRCPAVTLELGPIGDPRGDLLALDYLERCLALDEVPTADAATLRLYRAEARVHVAPGVAFGFAGGDESRPLVLTGGLEAVNFHELPPGTEFAAIRRPLGAVLEVRDALHRNVTDDYFVAVDGRVRLRRAVTPAMFTTDPAVVRQDCLCYFMAPLAQERLRAR